jgi:glycosyltransferase involved in cell wall biosynthesis
MIPLTAVIITKNEEANIRACLEPLLELAAEVLVVDSGSTDATVAIAREMGAKVIETQWKGYSATKNFGNSQAKHDWILSIDADEVVSDELKASLLELSPERGTTYALDRLTNYCGTWIRHSGWYPEWKIRLFHREDQYWTGEFVHEILFLPPEIKVRRLTGKLYHYSYKNSEDHLARIERYARLSAAKLHAKGKKTTFVKQWLSPGARFFRTFFLKKGFLDGKAGWTISIRNAWLVYRKYQLLKQLTD